MVAVHGLNGSLLKPWTTKNTEKFWFADLEMLPKNMSNARILSYSYDASSTAISGRKLSDRILQHAHALVMRLKIMEKHYPVWVLLGCLFVICLRCIAAQRSQRRVSGKRLALQRECTLTWRRANSSWRKPMDANHRLDCSISDHWVSTAWNKFSERTPSRV